LIPKEGLDSNRLMIAKRITKLKDVHSAPKDLMPYLKVPYGDSNDLIRISMEYLVKEKYIKSIRDTSTYCLQNIEIILGEFTQNANNKSHKKCNDG